MKRYKDLDIKGAFLNKEQLADYLKKLGASHTTKKKSSAITYPIYKLRENFKIITDTYRLLNQHIKLGIHIHSAGEWILDNYYIIEEAVKVIEKDMKLKKYTSLPAIDTGRYKDFARVYVFAAEIVAFTDAKVNDEIISESIRAYQEKNLLTMEEICNLGIFFKIAIIQNLRDICDKILSAQIQKNRVESIIERTIERKRKSEQKYTNQLGELDISRREMRYAFIEYMAYSLKRYGKDAIQYINVLEEEVAKMGLTVDDVIKKEHFNIANLKVMTGNCITSIKDINRINFGENYENISTTEEILKKDPSGIYAEMLYESKILYRNKIKKISEKYNISEIYIAEKLIELSSPFLDEKNLEERRKSHIGYFLIDEGYPALLEKLIGANKKYISFEEKSAIYTRSIFLLIVLILLGIGGVIYSQYQNILLMLVCVLVLVIPIYEITTKIINYIIGKLTKPKSIPKLALEGDIPEEYSTFVVVPTIIKDEKKVEEIMKKLEVYYLANRFENLYFALLGDCTQEQTESTNIDFQIQRKALEEIEKLNKKYSKEGAFPKFHFLYRKRTWNEHEGAFIGWERKRGLLVTFNQYIKRKIKNNFLSNTIEKDKNKLPNIKYIITLDADTELTLNSAKLLIGSMAHILNQPIVKDKKVVKGYGIMQPRVGLDLSLAKRSLLVQLYAVQGGVDSYTNVINDVYQDFFGEGIFTGKGIYDVDVYNEVMEKQIPENIVLSHDLLEGNYLRCALINDVMLLDGYPYQYNAYILRNHRWIRGDWQIIRWLVSDKMNTISKFKIFDNLVRSLVSPISLFGLILSAILLHLQIGIWIPVLVLSLIALLIQNIIDVINYIVFKESNIEGAVYAHKKFSKEIYGVKNSLYRSALKIAFLPYEASMAIDAIGKSIYRQFRKKHLLEWATSEEVEKASKTDLKTYYGSMFLNVVLGVFAQEINHVFFRLLGIVWFAGPLLGYYISIQRKKEESLKKEELQYLNQIGKKTWEFFSQYMNEENNFLITDNYQENRKNKIVNRTSSTNIGLSLLAVVSAYDMNYITSEEAKTKITQTLNTIMLLPKWNGHLYNWYNTKTMEPLIPKFVSTVDSGNLVGYLYVLKQFLMEHDEFENQIELLADVQKLIDETDFKVLYSERNRLFSIGYNVEDNKLIDSYYDFLASEARQASFVAIAKKDVSEKHWNNLSRTLTSYKKYKGLISWSGTTFEYLMPNINMKRYEGSILDESSKFLILSQIDYCNKLGVPWGISESAFNLKDLNSNYQYKAFGIPWLGLKRGLEDEIVISPYSTFLSLEDVKSDAIENLRRMQREGAVGKYGFYEAIDYTPRRLEENQKGAVVKTYMAHHQGLILLSINNIINHNVLKKRFEENPEMKAVNILLQERMPAKMIITKEKKIKVDKVQLNSNIEYGVRIPKYKNDVNIISNENYTVCMLADGTGFSKYKNILINKFKETNDYEQGIYFYLKNLRTQKIENTLKDAKVEFFPDKSVYTKEIRNIKLKTTISVVPNRNVEIRRLEIQNNSQEEETLEIVGCFEPVISEKIQEYMHPAFNNFFLRYEMVDDILFIKRISRDFSKEEHLAVKLYTESENIGDLNFEIDREKFLGRDNIDIPVMIKESKEFSNEIKPVLDPIVALKRIMKIQSGQKIKIDLLIACSENKEELLEDIGVFKNESDITKMLELSMAKMQEETKYLNLSNQKVELYQKMLSYIIFTNRLKENKVEEGINIKQRYLWRFGISGDHPIILATINNMQDLYVIDQIVEAYKYITIKNIEVDLVIVHAEENIYEQYIREGIELSILNSQLSYKRNVSNGIFVINAHEFTKEEKATLEFKSCMVIDCNDGDLYSNINELEKKYSKHCEMMHQIEEHAENVEEDIVVLERKKDLKYDNSYGGFTESGREYNFVVDEKNKLPTVWSHIIANEQFGTLVTENMSGFTWSDNSRLNRLTTWSNNATNNIASEMIFMRNEENGKRWIIGQTGQYNITYGFGYAVYKNVIDNVSEEVEVFVPLEETIKLNRIRLRNLSENLKKFKMYYYLKPVLGEDEIKTKGAIKVSKQGNIIYAENLYNTVIENNIMFVSCSEQITSYTGSKKEFIGCGTIKNPSGIYGKLNKQDGVGEIACIAFEVEVILKSFETKEVILALGKVNHKEEAIKKVEKYVHIENSKQELENVKNFWTQKLNTIKVKTPLESMNIMLNGWMIYQTYVSRLWARTAFYQSGGAIGFRDQLQDTLGLKYIDIEIMKKQILLAASHQFIEGDVEHWWHAEVQKGIRTRFSDDLLWLVYVLLEYLNYTGDYSILDICIPYVEGEVLQADEDEKYDYHYPSHISESIYMHAIRAIDRSLDFEEDNFPKIGTGDWNDGFSNIGAKGEGRSIWLGFFLYDILNRFIPICQEKNDQDKVAYYEQRKENLKRTLNKKGWDGRWFKRAITDEGIELGSMNSEECRIDSISQSWSVISNAAENDKKYIAMDSLDMYLADKENNIIKLLSPAFEKAAFNPGYIKAYPAGIRENGGQYTHASIWAMLAETLIKRGNKAVEYFNMINPIEHAKTKDGAKKYKIEPYVLAGDVYSASQMEGRGGWSWYTGSSSWFYKVGIENILGLQIQKGYLTMEPCIPKEWKEYEIKYQYKDTKYYITVKNPNGKSGGVSQMLLNRQEVPDMKIKLINNQKINEIEIIL